jgi:hypothetical protein
MAGTSPAMTKLLMQFSNSQAPSARVLVRRRDALIPIKFPIQEAIQQLFVGRNS